MPVTARLRKRGAARVITGAVVALCMHAVPVPAQEARIGGIGSPYLSLDHWAYDYLDVLVARGRLPRLSPLVQPYRRIEVAGAVHDALDGGGLSPTERTWAEAVAAELAHERALVTGVREQELRFGGTAEAGGKGLTQVHRDVLRPAGDGEIFPLLQLDLLVDAPRLAAGFRMRWDNHLLHDPQFPGGQVVESHQCDPIVDRCGYRVDEGYVEMQMPYVRLFFGRLGRNWGLPGTEGLLLSSYPYSYDQLAYTFGSERLSLRGLLALPNDFREDTTRFFATHRLDWRLLDNLSLGLQESVIYGGPGRRLELGLVSPVTVWEVSGGSGTGERNTLGGADLWWRPLRGLVLFGAIMVDNTRVGDPGLKQGLTQWATALGVQLPGLTPRLGLRADLSIVNSLAYRSRIGDVEAYAFNGIGLGRDKTDAIVVSLRGDWFAAARLVVRPQIHLQWKGEDDLRSAWPDSAFSTHPDLLVGQAERTIRPAIAGRWRIGPADIQWDWGVNLIADANHVPGVGETRFEGRIQAVIRKRFLN